MLPKSHIVFLSSSSDSNEGPAVQQDDTGPMKEDEDVEPDDEDDDDEKDTIGIMYLKLFTVVYIHFGLYEDIGVLREEHT